MGETCVLVMALFCMGYKPTTVVTPRAHARSGVKQSVLSVSQSSVSKLKETSSLASV